MTISSLNTAGPSLAQSLPGLQPQSSGGSTAVQPGSGGQQTQAMPSAAQVQQAMKTVQDMVQAQASNLQFSLDQETGKTIVTVVDSNTNQVIRQIPSKEMLAIAHAIDQMQSKGQGLMLSQKA